MQISRAAIGVIVTVACAALSACSSPSQVAAAETSAATQNSEGRSNESADSASSEMPQAPAGPPAATVGWRPPQNCPDEGQISSIVGQDLTLDSPNSSVCFYMSADNDVPLSLLKMPGSPLTPGSGSEWPRVSIAEGLGERSVEVRDASTDQPICQIQIPTSPGFYAVTAQSTSLDSACARAKKVLESVATRT